MTLSPRQRLIAWLGAFCICSLMVYVPWVAGGAYGSKSAGYAFVFSPPETGYTTKIDYARAVLPAVAVLLLTVTGVVLSKGNVAAAKELEPAPQPTDPSQDFVIPPILIAIGCTILAIALVVVSNSDQRESVPTSKSTSKH